MSFLSADPAAAKKASDERRVGDLVVLAVQHAAAAA